MYHPSIGLAVCPSQISYPPICRYHDVLNGTTVQNHRDNHRDNHQPSGQPSGQSSEQPSGQPSVQSSGHARQAQDEITSPLGHITFHFRLNPTSEVHIEREREATTMK
eukprot:9499897-Pyramimonas_sp.AAC.1